MKVLWISVFAVAALTAAPLAAAPVASASASATHKMTPEYVVQTDEADGPTLAAAEQNAKAFLQGDYGPCHNVTIYASGSLGDGLWYADASGLCSSIPN